MKIIDLQTDIDIQVHGQMTELKNLVQYTNVERIIRETRYVKNIYDAQ